MIEKFIELFTVALVIGMLVRPLIQILKGQWLYWTDKKLPLNPYFCAIVAGVGISFLIQEKTGFDIYITVIAGIIGGSFDSMIIHELLEWLYSTRKINSHRLTLYDIVKTEYVDAEDEVDEDISDDDENKQHNEVEYEKENS